MSPPSPTGPRAFGLLRQFIRPRKKVERCELCALELPPHHVHLLEYAQHRIVCSCDACAILFSDQQGARYRRIPRDAYPLPEVRLSDAQWDALRIPINLAFFFHNSQTNKITALYPAPSGAVEALLPLEAWPDLVAQFPVLGTLAPDVEALLVNRIGGQSDCFRTPIDTCFHLVGLIRSHWRGLSGGAEVWEHVARFFAALRGSELPGGHGDA